MSLDRAVFLFQLLLALSLIVQTVEFIALAKREDVRYVWSWSVQGGDLKGSHPLIQRGFDFLYRDKIHNLHLVLRLLCAISLFWGVTLITGLFLFLSTVILLIRWRGAFNGGSDFMTVIAVTGLVIAMGASLFVDAEKAWNAALWYITIHSITSYFMSGTVKLLNGQWRNGTALTYFLDGGLYGPLSEKSVLHRPFIAALASWSFIIWEVSFPFVLVDPYVAVVFCTIALFFHLLVFRFFGLNRFIWAWIVTFPSIIYCSGQI